MMTLRSQNNGLDNPYFYYGYLREHIYLFFQYTHKNDHISMMRALTRSAIILLSSVRERIPSLSYEILKHRAVFIALGLLANLQGMEHPFVDSCIP